MKIFRLIFALLFATALFAQSQKPYPGVDLPNVWTAPNTFGQIIGTPTTVSGLGSSVTNAYSIRWVSDSTTVTVQGQNCVGGGTSIALAFSNGTSWNCFGSSAGGNNQAVSFVGQTSASVTAQYNSANLVWNCWDGGSPVANAIYPSNVTLNTSTFLMTFIFAVPQTGFCVINGGGGGGGGGGGAAWQNQGVTLGTPSTINCTTNLNCSLAAGTLTITASGASSIPNPLIGANLTPATQPWKVQVDQASGGPNPWIDIRNYGARAIYTSSDQLANGGITGSIASGSTTLTVTTTTIVNGDSILCVGCGTAHAMTTPSTPTVAAMLASGPTGTGNVINNGFGSTTWCYKIAAADKLGGYTPASGAACVTNGAASLGSGSLTVTGSSQSNGLVTITTAARSPDPLVATAMVRISDGEWVSVNSVPNNTSFTFVSTKDTRNGQTSAAIGSGQTINYWTGVNVVLSSASVAPIWKYLVWVSRDGGTTYSRLAVSKPVDSVMTLDQNYFYVEDYGATMMANPAVPIWMPSTPPSAPQNDGLSTKITSGGGTATLTTAIAAGTGAALCGTGTCSAATILLDVTPAVIAAATAATFPGNGGVVYIPSNPFGSSYTVQTYCDLSQFGNVSVIQSGNLYLNDTINIGQTIWRGDILSALISPESFSFLQGPTIQINDAMPGLYDSQKLIQFSGVSITNPANNYISILVTSTGGIPIGRLESFSIGGGGSSDYMGIPILFFGGPSQGGAGVLMQDFSVSTGPSQTPGTTATPLISNSYIGEFTMKHYIWNRRGYFEKVNSASSNNLVAESDFERQGGITPMFTFMPVVNGGGFTAKIHNHIQDTEGECFASNLQGIFSVQLNALIIMDTQGNVCGVPFGYISTPSTNGNNPNLNSGQNFRASGARTGSSIDGIFSSGTSVANTSKQQFDEAVGIGPGYELFVDSIPATAPVASSPSNGGTLAANTFTFVVTPVILEAGGIKAEGTPSFTSNAVTTSGTCPVSGNCTIVLNWTAVPGAIGYDVYSNGVGLSATLGNFTGTTTTFSAPAAGNGAPSLSGGGVTGMNTNGLWGPVVYSPAISVLGRLDQTGVSMANSGSPQTIATAPESGHYLVTLYIDQSAGCATVGSGGLTAAINWTDGTNARTDAGFVLTPGTVATGTGSYLTTSAEIWAAAASAITITNTYTACSSGTWTYDVHARVEELK